MMCFSNRRRRAGARDGQAERKPGLRPLRSVRRGAAVALPLIVFTLAAAGTASGQPTPALESVYLIGAPTGGVHAFGSTVTVHAQFNREDLAVTGRPPRLALTIGAHQRHAEFEHIFSHQGERRYFSFAYVVQEADRDEDGISIPANALTLDGGAIRDADGNAANLTHDAVPDDPEHTVDGSIGAPVSIGRWVDHPIRPGVTPIKAVHFEELRTRVATLRAREGLGPSRWTDPDLTPGATVVRQVHLAELRAALGGVYAARNRTEPGYTDRAARTGQTPVRAAHIMELREAVEILENPTPSLAAFYSRLPSIVIDRSYRPHAHISASTDLDGDGNEDLVLLGLTHPTSEVTAANHRPQPGRVFLGDGDGGFRRAPADLFPVDTLNTVVPRKVPFGDLNGDGLPDMFISATGWDELPHPGEQNRLYLSRPGGGWRDATSELPQLSDYSHSAAIGDIRGLGIPDILVVNYGGSPDVPSYVILNNGDETFSLDRSNLPVGPDETLNYDSRGVSFTGTMLADLDGDELPELIALGEGYRGYLGIEAVSFVFWNRSGAFSEQHKTPLPSPEVFAQHGHIDLDAAALDADGDGLLDLVIVGTQYGSFVGGPLDPFYDGWFVQLLMNRGDGTFADETSLRLQPHEQSSGNAGVATNAPWARWVDVVDFNGDGAADFVMDTTGDDLRPNQPLIWLNDGSGRFSALKVHDLVRPGDEWLLFGARLVRTRHGYSYITTRTYPGSGGLILTGLLANRPYR